MTVVDYIATYRPLDKAQWWDVAGIVVGAVLVVLYTSGAVPNLDVLVYAGLVALVTHAYVSTEHLDQTEQVALSETVVAYRQLVATRQWNPSGGTHVPDRAERRRHDRVVA